MSGTFHSPIVFMLSVTDRKAGGTPLRRHGVTPCGIWLTVPNLHDVLCDGCRMAKHSSV